MQYIYVKMKDLILILLVGHTLFSPLHNHDTSKHNSPVLEAIELGIFLTLPEALQYWHSSAEHLNVAYFQKSNLNMAIKASVIQW